MSSLLRSFVQPLGRSASAAAGVSSIAAHGALAQVAEAPQPVASPLRSLEELKLESPFTDALPADPDTSNSLRQVHGALYSYVDPTPTGTQPYLVAAAPAVAQLIGLEPGEVHRPEFAAVFSGNAPLPGGPRPYAQAYGGHQFGSWAGQLGDGRAINLGAAIGPDGQPWELQLKGAGVTPYSRRADGRAVMRSSLREFVASEALYHLGVPTTRALSLVGTGAEVVRDMFYNGNVRMEPGAVVCRVAHSFVRFGSFQLPASRGGGDLPLVRLLADYVIRRHFPHLQGREDCYAAWLGEVAERTGRLVAAWQSVGFCHGVLNTDNMSILGDTIDYGPYGFLERFDPAFTPNASDLGGLRYTFRNQPEMCNWNVAQLANALLAAELMPLDAAEAAVGRFSEALTEAYQASMAAKLGLRAYDKATAVHLLTAMYEDGADFTNTFRALASVDADADAPGSIPAVLHEALGQLEPERAAEWGAFLDAYRARLRAEGMPLAERRALQDGANPCYIPRNALMQDAIRAAEAGSFDELHALMAVLEHPYTQQPGAERFTKTEGQVRMGVELLSCSS